MTFRVNFYAEQAFLNMTKRILRNSLNYDEILKVKFEVEESSTCIILCQSALEGFLNNFGQSIVPNHRDFVWKGVDEKFDELFQLKSASIDWGLRPFQRIKGLIKVRNWLIHFKDSNLGLINSTGQWVVDSHNKKPKIDDTKELNYKNALSYYNDCRDCLKRLTALYGEQNNYEFLTTEDYQVYLIG